jgi:hypothetical protein
LFRLATAFTLRRNSLPFTPPSSNTSVRFAMSGADAGIAGAGVLCRSAASLA